MKRLAFHLSSTSFPLLAVTTLLACGSAATLPDMSSTSNDLSMRAGDYPAGPYGTGQGSVIDDLVLSGELVFVLAPSEERVAHARRRADHARARKTSGKTFATPWMR